MQLCRPLLVGNSAVGREIVGGILAIDPDQGADSVRRQLAGLDKFVEHLRTHFEKRCKTLDGPRSPFTADLFNNYSVVRSEVQCEFGNPFGIHAQLILGR